MNRREAIAALSASVASTVVAIEDPPGRKPTQALMLAYPQFTLLDLVGPHSILSMVAGIQVKIVAKTKDPITTDTGVTIQPQQTLKDTTEEPLLIFVPGGTSGTLRAMEDKETIEFLKSRGAKATYVTSVCTGSLVLGAAGLLKCYQATKHWAAMDLLKPLGASPIIKRVVEDRNRFTGAGVTAGLDFGLRLAAKLKDDKYAQSLQLAIEYDPEPPYRCGSPTSASVEQVKSARTHFSYFLKQAETVVKRVTQ